ncbi:MULTISPECIES: DUF6468 domain-containing protein [Gluconacetobacter]|uniref:DUF6468 domain-containing protein n=1 Tax=Gluconacetobacter TaxID=89583 RepID=UPI001C7F0F71|nr:DUF6468 domain-containing protein [Gluconacetobacter dulcium]
MLTQIQLIIEIVLSFFLLLGIIYSFYLSRVLSNLKHDRESLMGLVEKLEASVKSAEEGVEKLRIAGEVSGRPLSRMIELAKVTGTELDTMVEKADATAGRLEMATIKASPHERKLEQLLEKASEIELKLHAEVQNQPVSEDTEHTIAAAVPAEIQENRHEPARSQQSAKQDEPVPPRNTTPPIAQPAADNVTLRATRDESPALRPSPPPAAERENDGPKNARSRASTSNRQKNHQMKRLENTFLGRPAR